MNITVNKEKITELLKDFYLVTKLRVALFDTQGNELSCYPTECSSLCSRIRSREFGFKMCKETDKNAFLQVSNKMHPYIYSCHAGLTEGILPFVYQDNLVGFLMFGQVKVDGNNLKSSGIIQTDDNEATVLQTLYDDMSFYSEEIIHSAMNVLKVFGSYIRFSEYVYLFRGGVVALVEDYLRLNYFESITIQMLSERFNIGRTQLSVKFKKMCGATIVEYVNRLRIEKALKLLKNSNNTGAQIAEAVGFQDYNYFARVFKKVTGMTLSQIKASQETFQATILEIYL